MRADVRPSRPATAAIACLVATVGLALPGCSNDAQRLESLCEGFETSWNALAAEAQANGTDPEFAQRVSQTAESWSELARLGGPSDVTDVIRNAASNLQNAWSTTSKAERHSQATSLHHSAEYVTGQCEKAGSEIELDALGLPYRPL